MRDISCLKCVLVSVALVTTLIAVGCSSTKKPETTGDETNILTFSNVPEAQKLASGENVVVAVIDWQFDIDGDAAEKYVDAVSMVPGEPVGELKPWHGEWMAELVHQIAPKAKIVPIRARSLEKKGYEEYLIKGIYYAADHGAAAVSSSMGPLKQSEELTAAIDYADERGTVFVNVHPETVVDSTGAKALCPDGVCDPRIIHTGIVSVPEYPCEPESNRDLYTWAYDLDANYKDGWGYSNAPPVVVGTIALMKSVNPGLGPGQIREILKKTATVKDGFAVVDALKAVEAARATGQE